MLNSPDVAGLYSCMLLVEHWEFSRVVTVSRPHGGHGLGACTVSCQTGFWGTASVVGCRPSDFVSVMEIGTGGATKAEEKSRWKVFGRFLRAMSRLQIRGGLLVGRVSPLLFTALRLRQAQGQRLDISEPVLQ